MTARKKPAQPATPLDLPTFVDALEKFERLALVAGAAFERARIAAILSSAASGQRALAWELVLTGAAYIH